MCEKLKKSHAKVNVSQYPKILHVFSGLQPHTVLLYEYPGYLWSHDFQEF